MLLLVGAFFSLPQPADAVTNEIGQKIALTLANIANGLVEVLGKLLLLVTDVFLIPIASYNEFVTSKAVETGWVIVRDLTNMFFVLIMLVIAIGTILGIDDFSYRRLLPRLLLMAVLINFSKVIVGLFIDFSQVLMLTFVNGFAAAAGGNIIELFRLKEAMEVDASNLPNDASTPLDSWDYFGAQILALLMIVIALMIVVVMCMMLAFRIVMLWILTILSPLAFFLSTFPRGKAQQAYADWWSKFGNYTMSGPVLAFFLWLSFATVQADGINPTTTSSTAPTSGYFITEAGDSVMLFRYIIGVALLLGGMYITADFGVAAGGMLRSGADWFKNTGQRLAKGAALAPLRLGLAAGKAGASAVGTAAERSFYANTGRTIPFTKRSREFSAAKDALKETDAKRSGDTLRWERAMGGVQKARTTAGQAREVAETKRAELNEFKLQQKASGEGFRSQADNIRGSIQGEGFAMNDQMRTFLEDQRQYVTGLQQAAVTQGNMQQAAAYSDQAIALAAAAGTANGQQVSWMATPDMQAARGSINQRANYLTARARQAEGRLEPTISDKQGEVDSAEALAKAAEKTAGEYIGLQMKRPAVRVMSDVVAKEISAQKDKMKDMSISELGDEIESALQGGDKIKVSAALKQAGDDGKLRDLLSSGKIGNRKFGTNQDSLRELATILQETGMSENETLRTLDGAFGSAVNKGDTAFHGHLARGSAGGFRWVDQRAVAQSQGGKLDQKGPKEMFGKASGFTMIFNNDVQFDQNTRQYVETTKLSDGGKSAIKAYAKSLENMLSEKKVANSVLAALKKPEVLAQLREQVTEGLLEPSVLNAITNATSAEARTAKEMANKISLG